MMSTVPTATLQQQVAGQELTRTNSAAPVIYLRPTREFLEVLLMTGTKATVFTRQEIIVRLKDYIVKHELYDKQDPRTNRCDAALKKAFNVDQFTVNDVLNLISANTTVASSKMCYIEQTVVGDEDEVDGNAKHIRTHDAFENAEVKRHRKRKRAASVDLECSAHVRRRSSSFSTVILTSEDDGLWSVDVAWTSDLESGLGSDDEIVIQCYQDDSSDRLSVQSKETLLLHELSENWFSDDGGDDADLESVLDISFNPYRIEYDVVSLASTPRRATSGGAGGDDDDDDDTASEPPQDAPRDVRAAMFVVCRESDVEFFADYSNSEDDGCSDTEIPPEDRWRCSECDHSNSPVTRRCQRCWAVRPGWLHGHGRRRHLAPSQRPTSSLADDYDARDSPVFMQEAIINSLASSEPSHDVIPPQPISDFDTSALAIEPTIHKTTYNSSLEIEALDTVDGEICDSQPLTSSQMSDYWSQSSTLSARALDVTSSQTSHRQSSITTSSSSITTYSDSQRAFPFLRTTTEGHSSSSYLNTSREGSSILSQSNPFTSAGDQSDTFALSRDSLSRAKSMRPSTCEPSELTSMGVASRACRPMIRRSFSQDAVPSTSGHLLASLPATSRLRRWLDGDVSQCGGSGNDDRGLLTAPFTVDGAPPCKRYKTQVTPNECAALSPQPSCSFTLREKATTSLDLATSRHDATTSNVTEITAEEPTALCRLPATNSASDTGANACIICLIRPKNASLVHGNTGHQVCCYKCAKRLRRRGKACPVCRRTIQKVIRNFIV